MTDKRKKTETFIIKHIAMLDPDGSNTARYEKMFSSMTDEEFHDYMESIRTGEEQFYLYIPNLKKPLNMQNILDTAKSLGTKMMERIWMTDTVTGQRYLTPVPYLCLQLPIRRVSQYQDHKMTVGESDKRIDLLSGQLMKPDHAGSISLVEMQTLDARGLHYTIAELAKHRGGDISAYASMKQSIEETGMSNITLEDTGTVARSVTTLNSYLKAMHLRSNLVSKLPPSKGVM